MFSTLPHSLLLYVPGRCDAAPVVSYARCGCGGLKSKRRSGDLLNGVLADASAVCRLVPASSGAAAAAADAVPAAFASTMMMRSNASGSESIARHRHVLCGASLAPGPEEKARNGAAVLTGSSRNKGLGIVITGGSKGLGFALARKFLELHDRVVICGRDERRLNDAIATLRSENEGALIDGITCDVSNNSDVKRLADFAKERLGVIDRWLNNAGEVTSKRLLADVEPDEIIRVSGTNVLGSLLCCREAVRYMRDQPASSLPIYHIFNMGFSQWGAKFTKSACTHKATKIALTQLNESLSEELKTAGISSIGVHNLSPGLVLTDLLLKDSTPIARRFFNALAEEPETAAAILVPRIREVQGSGQSLNVLSPISAICKVVTGFPQILSGGRFFDKDGNRVSVAGKTYHENGVEVIY